MRIYKEEAIKTYGAWCGAKELVDRLTYEEAMIVEDAIEECYPEGIDETQLNDILWFEDDWILGDILGMTDEEAEDFWNR